MLNILTGLGAVRRALPIISLQPITEDTRMALIQCTKKLLDELPQAEALSPRPTLLGDWHANMIRIERRKCVLFMNDRTYFSLFLPGLKKADFQNLTNIFVEHLAQTLKEEGLTNYVNRIEEGYGHNLTFTRTSSRNILGVMNNFIRTADFMVHRLGGIEGLDPLNVNRRLNRTPLVSKSAYYPIEVLTQILKMEI